MKRRDSKTRMSATQSHSHAVGLRETEIPMDLPHHVENEFVGGITPVHGMGNFRHRVGADVFAPVVALAIIFFQPMFKGKADASRIDFVGGTIGDGANTKEGVAWPWWGPAFRRH